MDNVLPDIRSNPARQQPVWGDAALIQRVRDELESRPGLVKADDLWTLRSLLARVVDGEATVVQAGDCAEVPDQCTKSDIVRKVALLDLLAGAVAMATHRPVVRAGRIAGQFAKPRSNDTERIGDVELPVFRGHIVNSPAFDVESRRPDPERLLKGYDAASGTMVHLGWHERSTKWDLDPLVWTSHEALVLDYELPLLRRDEEGRLLLASTHWPWIGARTNQVDSAHVALLSEVINPVACKVGPTMTTDHLLRLCELLDPEREKGRLTLISRMGAGNVAEKLPPLVEAVRAAGHPVVWLCDPMHGNTVSTPSGFKTRFTESIEAEITHFRSAVATAGGVLGGLHLETTPDDVIECVRDGAHVDQVGDAYTSYCDPRLNPRQALDVVSAWQR